MPKTQTSIRITFEAKALLEILAQKNGISKASVIEMAVRRMAEAEGVTSKEKGGERG